MSEAQLVLLGVIVGAVLAGVFAYLTQRLALRAEVDRYWVTCLHKAASDLVTSYMLDRSALDQARRSGRDVPPTDDEMSYELRRLAQGRLFTLPGGMELAEHAENLRRKTDALHEVDCFTSSQQVWSLALSDQELAVQAFNECVAKIVNERSKVRLRNAD